MEEYREYIKQQLGDIKSDIKSIEATLVTIQLDVGNLKTITGGRMTFYGIVGGFIPAVAVAVYFLLS